MAKSPARAAGRDRRISWLLPTIIAGVSVTDPIKALALCFAGVFCLTPLAIYLLWLAAVNRRARPTAVSGTLDFIALLAGLSGFLLLGAPIAITALQSNSRYWSRSNFEQLRSTWNQEKVSWLLVAGGYVAAVATTVTVGLSRRQHTLAVYAVDPDSLARTIHDQLAATFGPIPQSGFSWEPHIRLEPFPGMGHSLVRIVSPDKAKAFEFERKLRGAIPLVSPAARTPAAWIHIAAVGCAMGSICSLGLVIVYWLLIR
jgi:hypothetical protein